MSNYAVLSRFKRSILGVARVSLGAVPIFGGVYEDDEGRVFVNATSSRWMREDKYGRFSFNPDLAPAGRLYLAQDGRLFINTERSLSSTPGLYPADTLYPSDTLYPAG